MESLKTQRATVLHGLGDTYTKQFNQLKDTEKLPSISKWRFQENLQWTSTRQKSSRANLFAGRPYWMWSCRVDQCSFIWSLDLWATVTLGSRTLKLHQMIEMTGTAHAADAGWCGTLEQSIIQPGQKCFEISAQLPPPNELIYEWSIRMHTVIGSIVTEYPRPSSSSP